MTDFSRLSRFGMMFKPLTESRGEELLMLFRADFPVKTSPQQGGGGIEGNRSGMWKEMARIIGEVRPQYAFIENSPMLTTRGLERVLADLAKMGFDAEWGVLSAADVGANHLRERIWIVARNMGYSNNNGQIATKVRVGSDERSNNSKAEQNQTSKFERPSKQYEILADSLEFGTQSKFKHKRKSPKWIDGNGFERAKEFSNPSGKGLQGSSKNWEKDYCIGKNTKLWRATAEHSWWKSEPNMGRVADGVAARVDRLKAIGNGQVPLCAATAWKLLIKRLNEQQADYIPKKSPYTG
jgi:DNA (cytosine-5)-methyltransferase 1